MELTGLVSFGVDFFCIIIGLHIIGTILEAYGFIVLFNGFLPTVADFLQGIPSLGLYIRPMKLGDLYQHG